MLMKHGTRRLALVAGMLSIAPGCAPPTPIVLSPPAIDVEAATEPKPLPPVEIATDEAVALQYDLEIEAHGERIRAAAVRVCLWLNANGTNYDCKENK